MRYEMSTIQVDFNLPERFELEYQSDDGSRQRPIMIHRALFGSVERFFAVLTEHYAGAFPPWLAPVQVIGIPVAEEFNDYLLEIAAQLKAKRIRVEIDTSADRFPKKIRTAQKSKVPFMLIAGEDDRSAGAVSFRYRDGSQKNGVPIAAAIEEIAVAIESRAQV
jgi:threonyl-tRNA synthetase